MALNFPEVKDISVTASLLDSISINCKLIPYTYPLEIARLILLSYSPDISGGNEKMLALLFNMNQLWEEYVLVMLRKYLQGSSDTVTGQEKRRFWNYNYLQPDVVIRNTTTQEVFRAFGITSLTYFSGNPIEGVTTLKGRPGGGGVDEVNPWIQKNIILKVVWLPK